MEALYGIDQNRTLMRSDRGHYENLYLQKSKKNKYYETIVCKYRNLTEVTQQIAKVLLPRISG